jgi:hypothetical protein
LCHIRFRVKMRTQVLIYSRGGAVWSQKSRTTFSRSGRRTWLISWDIGGRMEGCYEHLKVGESRSQAKIANICNASPSLLEANGTLEFITGLALAIQEATGIPAPKSNGYEKIWKITWTGMYAKCLAAWLYEGCTLRLQRKWEVALTFFEWQPKLYRRRHITPKMHTLFGHLLPEQSFTQPTDL